MTEKNFSKRDKNLNHFIHINISEKELTCVNICLPVAKVIILNKMMFVHF